MKLTEESRKELTREYRLSPREAQLVDLILEGVDSNAELGERLGIQPGTAKQYLHVLYAKLGVNSKTKLIVAVFEAGGAFTTL